MKIKSIKAYTLFQSLGDLKFGFAGGWINSRQATIVIITTDSGLEGIGEAFGPPDVIAKAIETYLAPMLVGKDPFDSSLIWDSAYGILRINAQKGVLIEALGGLDIALWDIKGKAAGQPICKLLGGAYRNKALAYATGLYRPNVENPKEALVQEALGYKKAGFAGMKLKIGFASPEEDLSIIKAIRDAIGYDIKLMVDANCAYDAAGAIRLARQMEPYDIYWFEEPVPSEDIEGYIAVKNRSGIKVAGGECEYTHYGFRELIIRHAVDVLQPDICITGGFTAIQRILALASAWNMPCCPHVWGTNIAVAAALQFHAAIPFIPVKANPSEPFFEYDRTPNSFRELTTKEKFVLKGSYIDIPQKPGLGVTADMEFLEANATVKVCYPA